MLKRREGEKGKKEEEKCEKELQWVFSAEAAPAAVLLLGVPGQCSAVHGPAVTHHPVPRRVRGGQCPNTPAGAALAPSRAQVAARTGHLGGSCFSEELDMLLLALNGAYSHFYKPMHCRAKAAVGETWCHVSP